MPAANTSQLGLARLGQLQLGVVEPSGAPTNDRTGTSAVTAPAATLSASGTIVNAYSGTSAVTAAAATLTASGTFISPATGRLMLLGIG